MYSYRPLGVKLIVVFLLLSALGSVVAALCYWYMLVNPSSFLFNRISVGFAGPVYPPFADPSALSILVQIEVLELAERLVDFQLGIGMISAQVVFYLILSVLLVVFAVGLFRMKNWARVTTVIYSVLNFIFFFLFFFHIYYFYVPVFNINILTVLLFLSELDLVLIYLTGLVSLVTAILIPVYLFRDVKYEFH